MYPLHCNCVTTLPCKRITIKITIFIIVLVLKSNEKIEISQLANSSKLCKNSFFEDMFKVSAASFHKSSKFFDSVLWQIMPHCLQDFLQLVDSICLEYT